ncbi:MAG: DUF1800 family protein [Saprospiraceae bacterium]
MKYIYSISTIICAALLISNVQGQAYKDFIGAGHNAGVTVTASSNTGNATASKTIDGSGMNDEIMAASRFVSQATIGGGYSEINSAIDLGFDDWIDDQFTKAPTLMLPTMNGIWNQIITADPEAYGPYALHFNYAWWQNNMTNQDLLRQKVAYSLSQILVTSINSDLGAWGEAVSSYYDIFVNRAFGNYKDILLDVTKHPAMGYYLSHLNNPKTDLDNNIRPDENYAREIMQLFTIGLFQLNLNGTRVMDGNNQPIPTYNNQDIKEMAKIFTGLYAGAVVPCPDPPLPPECICYGGNNPSYCDTLEMTCCWWPVVPEFGTNIYVMDRTVPMQMSNDNHEPGSKRMPDGTMINIPNNGMAEINAAVDWLFNHQNTPPFVSYRLIQRLVKSNPSPEYVGRVAAKFVNNGSGVRGDMKAVIKAILLDDEARGAEALLSVNSNRLREPLMRYTHLARAIPTDTDQGRYWNNGYNFLEAARQHVMASPTVFNFYLPDYIPVGEIGAAGLVAPEFKLHNTATSVGFINATYGWTLWRTLMYSWLHTEENPDKVHLNTTTIEALANDTEDIINELDILLTHGQLSDETRQLLRTALNPLSWTWNGGSAFHRVNLAIHLIMISPDYACVK